MGQRAFGEIYGYCFMIFGLGSSLGRFLGGFVYDVAGSYNPALVGAAGALVVAVVLVNLLGPYTYPVRREIEPLLFREPATP
jgi:predicted MFS family arabinose efflux permease